MSLQAFSLVQTLLASSCAFQDYQRAPYRAWLRSRILTLAEISLMKHKLVDTENYPFWKYMLCLCGKFAYISRSDTAYMYCHHCLMQWPPPLHHRLRILKPLLIPSGFLASPKSHTTRIAFCKHLRQHCFQVWELNTSGFCIHHGTSPSSSLLISTAVIVYWLLNTDVEEDRMDQWLFSVRCSVGLSLLGACLVIVFFAHCVALVFPSVAMALKLTD